MDVYEFPFAKIIILRDDIAEVIINSGVIMDIAMVEQYHDFLLSHLRAPFSLLVNKVNAYTYDFVAQGKLATLKEINAMAVIAYNRVTEITTENLASFPRDVEWNLRIFSNRDEAMAWLESEQELIHNRLSEDVC
jgi:predicted house-cleaning noncanonical NTP pyrophosphatase (MazG superfamily)